MRGTVFQCDEKYQNYVEELESRGWTLASGEEDRPVPSACDFICKNLSRLKFATVFDRHVNHLRGSQHLSNKAFLTYHLKASANSHLLPPTWSSAADDAATLLDLLAINEVASIANSCLRSNESWPAAIGRIVVVEGIVRVLSQSPCYARSAEGQLLRALVSQLRDAVSVPAPSRAESERLLRALLAACRSSAACDESSTRNVWIIKPVGMSCGENIQITNKIAEVISIVSNEMKFKCVVQKYIERPLLVRSKNKFDIRQWVLVTSASPLVIYGFSQCYLRLSSQEYSLEDEGLSNSLVHLCNNAIQRKTVSGDVRDLSDVEPLFHPLMMTQNEFEAYLRSLPVHSSRLEADDGSGSDSLFEEVIGRQMKSIAVASICAVRDRLEKVGRGYEWLGFDFMVTENLEVKLLEINTSPDTSYSTPITEWLVKAATKDLMTMILDEGLTSVSEIKRTKGVRSSCVQSDQSPDAPGGLDGGSSTPVGLAAKSHHLALPKTVWELWYSGPLETKAQLQKLNDDKIDRNGLLNSDHKPQLVNLLGQLLTVLGDPGESPAAVEPEEESDEI